MEMIYKRPKGALATKSDGVNIDNKKVNIRKKKRRKGSTLANRE